MQVISTAFGVGEFWSLVPALVAILTAILTKQVYIALFLGVFTGAMFMAGGNILNAFTQMFSLMGNSMGGENGGILVFILMLGILVVLMTRAGGSKAFGNFASAKIKTRKGAIITAVGFGSLMFMDDYFNRLAVSSVMRGVTDKYRISRTKLACIVGSMSVSICILIPISSWAGAVTTNINEGGISDGLNVFLQTIGSNFYPFLTIIFIVATALLNMDLFGIRKHEAHAISTGDLFYGKGVAKSNSDDIRISDKGRVFDLLLPIAVLVVGCFGMMIYTGYFTMLDAETGKIIFLSAPAKINFMQAINNCRLSESLATGATLSVIFCMLLYLPRKLMSLKEFTDSFVDGFKSVADVLMILVLAWSISGVCEALSVGDFMSKITLGLGDFQGILPALLFLIAMGTSVAIGTAWGTFGILVPIVVQMFGGNVSALMIMSISAVLSGAVFGNQVSPLSDATILAASCAGCDHMEYIKAQFPIALVTAVITEIAFIVAGLSHRVWLGWAVCAVLSAAFLIVAYILQKKRGLLLPKYGREDIMKEEEKQDA